MPKQENTVEKHSIMFKEIILPYHSMFKGYSKEDQEKVLKGIRIYGCIYNAEGLVEQCMAIVGGYEHVRGGYGFDFSDNSDAKTVTLSELKKRILTGTKREKIYTSIHGYISNVGSKIGPLRVVVFNSAFNCLDYFYIPKSDVKGLTIDSSRKKSDKISIYYSRKDESYNLEDFRVANFEEVARKRG